MKIKDLPIGSLIKPTWSKKVFCMFLGNIKIKHDAWMSATIYRFFDGKFIQNFSFGEKNEKVGVFWEIVE